MAAMTATIPRKNQDSQRQPREKDPEELELEEQLFGTSKKRRLNAARGENGRPSGSELVDEDEDNELAGVQDDQLFMIDAPLAGASDNDSEVSDEDLEDDFGPSEPSAFVDGDSDVSTGSEGFDADSEDADEASTDDESNENASDDDGEGEVDVILPEDQYDVTEGQASQSSKPMPKGIKIPVWQDPSDELIGLNLDEIRRLRKLGRGKRDSKVGGAELERRLREQFERLHPQPDWAKQRLRKGVPSLSSLFASTKSFLDPASSVGSSSRTPLPQGTIELQRLRNANQGNPTAGKRSAANAGNGVVDFVWHPSPRVPVGVVAGGDRRIRFFNIDGHTNPTLLTLHIPSLPLTKTSFHPSGSSLLVTGTRPYYYTYDLASQKCLRSARNLFGSSPSPSAPQSLTTHSYSPDGSLLAVAGRRGAVSILDWSNTGAGAVVAELRSGRGGKTAGMVWSRDGREVEVLGGRDGAEVEVWDVGERKLVRRWGDDRAYGGSGIRRSKDGEYTAIGSSTGIVNMYQTASLYSAPSQSQSATTVPDLRPQPIKGLEHLTTNVSAMDFHPSGEMFVSASTNKKDALRVYHLPSATAFSNWPTPQTPLGRVTATAFSSSGEYLAVGNQRGHVLLWSLKHYTH